LATVLPLSGSKAGQVDRIYKARQFRERALELRNVALGLESKEGRDSLLIMADEYDRMADQAEKTKAPD
jgi:hypothetical protein